MPDNVKYGQLFKVVVRQITDATNRLQKAANPDRLSAIGTTMQHEFKWRRIIGSYQITIPVSSKEFMLKPEMIKLSVLKWILKSIPEGNRWFPVFNRYVKQISDRVSALGGDPTRVAASPSGSWQLGEIRLPTEDGEKLISFVGKIVGVIYDHFGDFEGFILEDNTGKRHKFKSDENRLLRLIHYAWIERAVTTVFVNNDQPRIPITVVLSGTPSEMAKKQTNSANS